LFSAQQKFYQELFDGEIEAPLVSVVVPAYNAEKHLGECVKSVVAQSYRNLEVILVDDGSIDETGQKCDGWAKKDSRIKVIHKANAGLNDARKTGYEASSGEYVTFLDSDDLLHVEAIMNTLVLSLATRADCVAFGHREFENIGGELSRRYPGSLGGGYFSMADKAWFFGFLFRNDVKDVLPMTAWGKLIRRSLVEKIDWSISNYRVYEDNFWIPQVYDSCKILTITSQQFYLYRHSHNHTNVLSKCLVGNTHNGRPVGYLQLVAELRDYYKKILKKNKLEEQLKVDFNNLVFTSFVWRIDQLVRAKSLDTENNLKYFYDFYPELRRRNDDEIDHLRKVVNERDAQIAESGGNIDFLSIKRSARLLAGNIKRRIKYGKNR
jgi:glycosyltransferase involved in cell wall biosynthesis